jgi:CheY-like chemotaxis protein
MKLCLIVSEDLENRENMREMAKDLGLMVYEVADSQFADVFAEAISPDVIVFDRVLSEENALIDRVSVLKSGKKPVILFYPDDQGLAEGKVFSDSLLQHKLISAHAQAYSL